ncbi:MAG: glycoside hydrolase family 20 zincin-like fold domain-containing protein, partial [Anaerolineae bacterium]
MSNNGYIFVPQPKHITQTEGSFTLTAATVIALAPASNAADFFAASQLQEEIKTATGLELTILKIQRLPEKTPAIILSQNPNALAGFGFSWGDADLAHGDQAYGIQITPNAVIACGNSSDGLYYAVQTLRQIART